MRARNGLAVLAASVFLFGGYRPADAQTNAPELFVGPPQAIPPARAGLMRSFPRKTAAARPTVEAPQASSGGPAPTNGIFTAFDPPGSVGTYAYAINLEGVITGFFADTNYAYHGFVRFPNGKLSTFNVPGDSGATFPSAINDLGVITGNYCEANGACPGFVRDVDGKFTSFDAPGDVYGTYPSGIDLAGNISGYYYDATAVSQGFVRDRRGAITTFDAPGGAGGWFGILPTAISPAGTVSGCYLDLSGAFSPFLRDKEGAITTFDVPGPLYPYCTSGFYGYTGGLGINLSGASTGSYFESIQGNPFGGNYRGFLRLHDGTFTGFDTVSDPSSPCCTWTWGVDINAGGAIAGFSNDAYNVYHGFLRAPDGTLILLDAPGAGTGNFQGTFAYSINAFGWIAGSYNDAAGVSHGFSWKSH